MFINIFKILGAEVDPSKTSVFNNDATTKNKTEINQNPVQQKIITVDDVKKETGVTVNNTAQVDVTIGKHKENSANLSQKTNEEKKEIQTPATTETLTDGKKNNPIPKKKEEVQTKRVKRIKDYNLELGEIFVKEGDKLIKTDADAKDFEFHEDKICKDPLDSSSFSAIVCGMTGGGVTSFGLVFGINKYLENKRKAGEEEGDK